MLFRSDLNGKTLNPNLLVVTGSGVLTNSSAGAVLNGNVNLISGSVAGASIVNNGSLGGTGSSRAVLVNNGTITASSGGQLDLFAAPVQNGRVNVDGTLNVVTAWTNGASGTVLLNGGVLTGGTFTVAGTVRGNGTIAADAVLDNNATITVNGGQLNLKSFTAMLGGTIDGGPVHNYGTISGYGTVSAAVSNPGFIRATGGTLFIQTLTGNQATGTLEASAGGTLQANGVQSWLNNGHVILSGGTVIGGTISNNAARIVTGYGTITSRLVNSGTLLAQSAGQTLTLSGATFVNAAGGVVNADQQQLVVAGVFTNTEIGRAHV